MDTDRITLPDFLIADLYKNCLVDLDTFSNIQKTLAKNSLQTEAAVETSTSDKEAALETFTSDKIKYFGENRKNVTIIVNEANSIYLNKEYLTFLTNILKACQLTIADIAIINAAKQQVTYTEIKEQLEAVQIVLFDVNPSFIKLPFMIPPFQVQKYADTIIMLAPALSTLNKSDHEGRLLKTKLWNSLKLVFNIS